MGTSGLIAGSHVTTDHSETIWVHEQPFSLWSEAWKWVYQIQNRDTRRVSAVDLVSQIIRVLDAATKFAAEILKILRKDFVYLGLDKKELTSLLTNFEGYIKAVSYYCFSLPNSAC